MEVMRRGAYADIVYDEDSPDLAPLITAGKVQSENHAAREQGNRKKENGASRRIAMYLSEQ
jgi:hypothetical protein